MTEQEFFWQLTDPDRSGYFQEGHGEHALLKAIRDQAAVEDKLMPDGLISSGNLSIYWSRKNVRAKA